MPHHHVMCKGGLVGAGVGVMAGGRTLKVGAHVSALLGRRGLVGEDSVEFVTEGRVEGDDKK